MPNRLLTAAAGIAAFALLWVGARATGPLPPLGSLLDPVHGVWAVARNARLPARERIHLPALAEAVTVAIDRRGVPHVFARTTPDAMMVSGYLTARDRLFQMEAQVRAAAGRLSEWAGRSALGRDRQSRALGLAWAAERAWARVDSASEVFRVLEAYSAGVNAWIDQLTDRTLPLEYRLLHARPIRWKPQYTLYLMAEMGYTLAYANGEQRLAALVGLVGDTAADALLPAHSPIQEPIIPVAGPPANPGPSPVPPLPPPRLQTSGTVLGAPDIRSGVRGEEGDVVGSNNWAVSPRRTAGAAALLAGDPHLDLSLPSIWYEIHLAVRDTLDVAGVSLPGAPGVVIGFNRDLAWSFTNTGADVLDEFRETVDDTLHPTAYEVDGTWLPVEQTIETYRDRRGRLLATDTLRRTHRGPLRRMAGEWRSMRWTVHDLGAELGAFLDMQRATTVAEWLAATAPYATPAQNGLVADRRGTIAIRSLGRFPVREESQGRADRVRDGTTRRSDWRGFLPLDQQPFAENPRQGFLASANQEPMAPGPGVPSLGEDWPPPWRALRLNALLRADSAVTPETMRRWQVDLVSARAQVLRAVLVPILAADSALVTPARLLASWDGGYRASDTVPIFFETLMAELQARTWDELTPSDPGGGPARPVVTPDATVLWQLLHDPESLWWDNRRTPRRERRDDIVRASASAAWTRLVAERGPMARGGWVWGGIRRANIHHILQLPSLSVLDLPVEGGPSTLAPSSGRGTHGASWRMVVELGPEVRAWGVYPGGQSGNPASPWYADRIATWQRGGLDTLRFPRRPEDLRQRDVVSQSVFWGNRP